MKSLLSLAFSILAFCGTTSTIDINEALKTGKITIVPTYKKLGNNGVLLTISNTTAQMITVSIPGGTIFQPEGGNEQVLMNIEEKQLALNGKETKSIHVGGYCTQLSKMTPRLDNRFKVGTTSNAQLHSLLTFLKTNKPSPVNYQAAVWALTDQESIAAIEPLTPADKKLREHIAVLTKQKDPWYTRGQTVLAEPGRPIQRATIAVKGNLEVTLKETTEFEIVVVNSTNEVKATMPTKEPIEKDIKHSFKFGLTVQGWEMGTYQVVLRKLSDESTIASFPFQVWQ